MDEETTKVTAGVITGVILASGSTVAVMQEQVDLAVQEKTIALEEKALIFDQKGQVLEQYVFAQVRIGEIPRLNASVVTDAEYYEAFYRQAEAKGALHKEDLFEGLRDKAVENGEACAKI